MPDETVKVKGAKFELPVLQDGDEVYSPILDYIKKMRVFIHKFLKKVEEDRAIEDNYKLFFISTPSIALYLFQECITNRFTFYEYTKDNIALKKAIFNCSIEVLSKTSIYPISENLKYREEDIYNFLSKVASYGTNILLDPDYRTTYEQMVLKFQGMVEDNTDINEATLTEELAKLTAISLYLGVLTAHYYTENVVIRANNILGQELMKFEF